MLELQYRFNVYKMLLVEMGRAGPCVDAANLKHLMHLLQGVKYKPFEDSDLWVDTVGMPLGFDRG